MPGVYVKWSGKEFLGRTQAEPPWQRKIQPTFTRVLIAIYVQMKPLLWFTVEGLIGTRGSQRDVVCLTNSALVYKPKCRGVGGLRGLSQWVQLCTRTWSPNKLWRSNSIFNPPAKLRLQKLLQKILREWQRNETLHIYSFSYKLDI